jgi:ElaB/YqjD/DUF883 family membrane-anchored ribosome-binding protein
MDQITRNDTVTKERLMTDVSAVLSDADALLRQAAQATGDQAVELRRKAQSAISSAMSRLGDVEKRVVGQAKRAATATDHWVQDHPWSSVGAATAVGVAVGVLIGLAINRR